MPYNIFNFKAIAILAPATLALLTAATANATTVTATNVAQLISALNAAQTSNSTNANPYTINLAQNGTYTLTAADNSTTFGNNGLPIIMEPVTIKGNGSTITEVIAQGATPFRIFQSFSSLTLDNVTLSNGNCGVQGDNIVSTVYLNGGGIEFSTTGASTLTLTNCTITGCSSVFGGGISNDGQGPVTLTGCTLSANSSQGGGGIGAVSGSPGPMSLTNCTVIGNSITGTGAGGGIRIGRSANHDGLHRFRQHRRWRWRGRPIYRILYGNHHKLRVCW